jgi:hypothetical protein
MDYHRGAGVEVKPQFLNRDLNLTTLLQAILLAIGHLKTIGHHVGSNLL